ncbi:MTRAB protein, partial [Pachyramphus minor]|nr:MTRAB protein [Pachyramphus minor]
LPPASSFSKPKVLTATSTLKFIPEELAVFCRDFRLLRFSFPENGLAPQAFRVANAIAQAREAAAWPGDGAEGHEGWSCPPEEDEEEEEEEEGLGMPPSRWGSWGHCAGGVSPPRGGDCGILGCPDLPLLPPPPSTCLRKAVEVASLLAGRRCSVVLQGGDTGSVGVQGDGNGTPLLHHLHLPTPPEPSDRDLNCLLASLVQLLGDPHARSLPGFQSLVQREWVAAGHPFPHRLGLLRRDTPREESPVFLLFLDCTWQLLRQFPADFGFTEAFLLALHDSSFSPYFSTFRFSCQRQRGHGSPPRSQTYRPVGAWQDPPRGPGGHRGGSSTCPFPPVWAWGLRYSREQRERFRNPAGPPAP